MNNKSLILIFVGMSGSGKSTCVDYVQQTHPDLPEALYFGGITVDEVKRRGLELNAANEKFVREDIRAKEGVDSHAKRISAKIDNLIKQGHTRILADGLYSWSEYKFFKQKYGDSAVIVAVATPRGLRHARLQNRPVRPLTPEEVNIRDYSEIENLEKGGPIANADYTLVNDSTTDKLHAQIDSLLLQIGF